MEELMKRVDSLVKHIQIIAQSDIVAFNPEAKKAQIAALLRNSQPRFLELPDRLLAKIIVDAMWFDPDYLVVRELGQNPAEVFEATVEYYCRRPSWMRWLIGDQLVGHQGFLVPFSQYRF